MTFVSYAQNFEDVLLWRVLRDVENGRYIDIGAQDPVIDSVSLAFYEAGWRGIHVEPVPDYATKLREARPDETVIEAAVTDALGPIQFHEIPETGLSTGRADIAGRHSDSGFENHTIAVPCIRLDKLFELAGNEVHWMKVDVEGMESEVLRSWGDSLVRPWTLIIEATYPNTQQPTKDLWIQEVVSRGYREVFFDGLSCYFLHESHAELADRFATPPNLFDAFHVTQTHFSAGLLTHSRAAELDRLRTESEERSAQLTDEIAGLHARGDQREAELTQVVDRLRQVEDRETNLLHELAGARAEFVQRASSAAEELARVREKLEAASSAAEEMQSARAEALEALAASERDHRQTVDRAWSERQASEADLRRGWLDLEVALRDRLASVESRLLEETTELAALRERIAQQDQVAVRLAETEQQLICARAELANLEVEMSRRSASAASEIGLLSQELAQKDATVAEADEIIRKAVAQPVDRWQRLGRLLALSRGDAARHALRSWDCKLCRSVSATRDAYMSFTASKGARNPYLRANSLSELLSWSDIDFVRCAYVTILGRQPDESGEAYYADRIRSGHSKMHVLWQLRNSEEGRRHDPGIGGLDRALRREARRRKPIIGRVWRWIDVDGFGDERLLVLRSLQNDMRRLVEQQAQLAAAMTARLDVLEATPSRLQVQGAANDSVVPSVDEMGQYSDPMHNEASRLAACAAEQPVRSGPSFGWETTLEPGEPWKPLRREPARPLLPVGEILNAITEDLKR